MNRTFTRRSFPGCGLCIGACAFEVLEMKGDVALVNPEKCYLKLRAPYFYPNAEFPTGCR
jgi:Fe-S-cluster-containing dehydrogenase component